MVPPTLRALVAFLLVSVANAQLYTIKTVAGGGTIQAAGSALSYPFALPTGLVVGSNGSVYVSIPIYCQVWVVSGGIVSGVVGNGICGYSGDNGPASSAQLNDPEGLAVDSAGNLYIADYQNYRVREVDTNGTITTIAGNGSEGNSGDGGPALAAGLQYPLSLALDSAGNLYVGTNGSVREVTAGTITTIAGTYWGYSGDGGPATSAQITQPEGLAIDSSGNLYIADTWNYRVRKVSGGIITTVAGTGTSGYSGDGGAATSAEMDAPFDVAVDSSGNLYIADAWNQRVRQVSNGIMRTIAGNGTPGCAGDGGAAISAKFNFATAIAIDSDGNLYIADAGNNRVRKVTSGQVSTIAGNGLDYAGDGGIASSAMLGRVQGVAVDGSGNIYFADSDGCVVREFSAATLTISTVVGNGTCGYNGDDGPAASAELGAPYSVALDSAGNLYIADSANERIRKVSAGIITTIAGNGTAGFAGDGGSATAAELNDPLGIAVSASNDIYIADASNNRVRKVSGGIITTVVGGGMSRPGDGGLATAAQLTYPNSVAVDQSGTLYLADQWSVRTVNGGIVNTVAGSTSTNREIDGVPATTSALSLPDGIALDNAGNLYISESGGQKIRRVSRGIITTIAGTGTAAYNGNNIPATVAELNEPGGIAVDTSGNLYIADAGNSRVRELTPGVALQEVPGVLEQISVGADGTVWGVTSAEQVYAYSDSSKGWTYVPGLLTQVAVGLNGDVWGITSGGAIYRFDPSTQNWSWIPGNLSEIAVGADGDVWGINSGHNVYHYDSAAQNWVWLGSRMNQIAVGYDGAVWALDGLDQIFRFNVGTHAFEQVPGRLAQISVGADGDVWGVSSGHNVYHFNSLTQTWELIPGRLVQVSAGSATNVVGIDASGDVYQFYNPSQSWARIAGALKQVSASASGAVWGVDAAGKIFRVTDALYARGTFHQSAGQLTQIAAGSDNNVWGLAADGSTSHFNLRSQSWENVPGRLAQISVAAGGNVWGIDSSGYIYRFDCANQRWINVPGRLSSIATAANGDVWGMTQAGTIYRYDPRSQFWVNIPGFLRRLAVGVDGAVWGVTGDGFTYHYDPRTQGWINIPGRLDQIAVGSANNVWGVSPNGFTYRFDASSQTWVNIPGGVGPGGTVSVAFDGTAWGMNGSGFSFRFDSTGEHPLNFPVHQLATGADDAIWAVGQMGQDGGSIFQYW